MDVARRDRLHAEWEQNEVEISRLEGLPVGEVEPVARHRDLLRRQREIEHELAMMIREERRADGQ